MKSFRRFLRVLGLLSFSICTVEICNAQAPPVRILPLGDSITVGGSPTTLVEGSYRNRLYNLLTGDGYNVDFVGTQTDVDNPALPDRDHQGMGGYRIDQIQNGLSSWLNVIEDPDVVLLLIGTNDFSANFNVASAQTRLASLIADIATKRPFAKIIVSNLPLRTDSASLEALQANFNASIPGVVSAQVALGRQVSFVDMHAALLAGDFEDGIHPSLAGYDKMADVWRPAITSVITPLGTANPPAIVRTEPAVDLQHIAVKFSKPIADNAITLTNFSLDGGLTISQAVLDPITKRTITLTTSAQLAGKLYKLTVGGIRDRTPAQNLIAPGSTVTYSSYSLVNGSFEAGLTGWTLTGNGFVYDTTPPYIASAGTKLVVMNGGQAPPNAVLTQTFPTIPGQTYALNFDIGILAANFSEQRLGVEVAGSVPLISQAQSVFGNGLSNSVWTSATQTFTANSSTTTLTFRDLSPTTDSVDLLLDNVRVTAVAGPANTAPVAVADSYSTNLNTPLLVPAAGVLANDTDAESNALTAVLNTTPSHGSVTLATNGGFTYTPVSGYTGPDSFTYHANDGDLDSNVATVTITVTSGASAILVNGSFESGETGWSMTGNYLVYGNNPPYVAIDGTTMVVLNGAQTLPNATITQTFATTPGKTYLLEFSVGILAANTSEQKLGVSLTGNAQLFAKIESVLGNGLGNSVWTAKSYAFTADSTTTALAFRDLSSTTDGVDLLLDNVKVTATGAPPNTAPVAVADSYSTYQDTPLVVAAAGILANDTDAQSDPLSAALNSAPAHGSLTLKSNGGFSYIPTAGYAGSDSFTYHANDGSLDSNVATVSINVLPSVADVLVNGSFESGFNGWTATGNQSIESYYPTHGSKIVAFDSHDLTPNGVLSQTFATVSGKTYSLTFDTGTLAYVKKNMKIEVNVTSASSLVSQTLTLTGTADGVSHWTSKTYSFVANSSTTTLTFRDRSTSTIGIDLLLDNVHVTGPPAGPNTAPFAVADSYSINKNTTLVVATAGVLSNDTDPQGDTLTAVLETGTTHGSLTLNTNGGFTYIPATGYTGADSFTYHANDGSLNSNTVTATISVNEVAPGILANPSFEAGFTGWTTAGNLSIETYPTTDGTKMVAFNGQNLTPNAVLSQAFATTAGKTYTLTFDAGVLAYTGDSQTLQVTATGTGSLLSRTITVIGGGGGSIRWLAQSFTFTADSSATTLVFRDQSTATVGIDLLLDNVRVLGAPTAASAPAEPAAPVNPAAIAQPPVALGTPSLTVTAGDAALVMTAPKAGSYVFERSADLTHWEEIDSMQCGAQDLIEFHDTQDPLNPQPAKQKMFYRIGFQPSEETE